MPALAGPPFVTDDPEIPPPHGWEINLPVTLEHETGEDVLEMPLVDINYGLTANVQLMVEFALLHLRMDEGRSERGLSDTDIGVKWHFLDETSLRPQMAFYPRVTIPTGDSRRGLGEGKPSYVLPLVAQKSWGPWTAFANLGIVLQNGPEKRHFWFHGLAVVREIGPRLELGGEMYGNSPTDWDEPSSLGFNVGGTWKVADGTGVLFSAGRTACGENAITVYLGIQLLLGGSGAALE
jgi:Putative MetA-pathway of phenol degradation